MMCDLLMKIIYGGSEQTLKNSKNNTLIPSGNKDVKVYEYKLKSTKFNIYDITEKKDANSQTLDIYFMGSSATILETPHYNEKINVYEKFDKVIRKSVELGSAIILLDKSLEQYMGNTVTGGDNIKAILMPTLNNAMIYLDKVCSKVNKNT